MKISINIVLILFSCYNCFSKKKFTILNIGNETYNKLEYSINTDTTIQLTKLKLKYNNDEYYLILSTVFKPKQMKTNDYVDYFESFEEFAKEFEKIAIDSIITPNFFYLKMDNDYKVVESIEMVRWFSNNQFILKHHDNLFYSNNFTEYRRFKNKEECTLNITIVNGKKKFSWVYKNSINHVDNVVLSYIQNIGVTCMYNNSFRLKSIDGIPIDKVLQN